MSHSVRLTDVPIETLKRKILAFEVLFDCNSTVRVSGDFATHNGEIAFFRSHYYEVEQIRKIQLAIRNEETDELEWFKPLDGKISSVLIEQGIG